MRLTTHELSVIRETLHQADPHGRVWLFGSRADDAKRGGDIDLYLEASRDFSLKASLALESRLRTLCDEKVDLLIKNPRQASEPIHIIARGGIPL